MKVRNLTRGEILKYADAFDFGFYRVTPDGEFVQCNSQARIIFGIPEAEADVAKYSIAGMYAVKTERMRRFQKLETEDIEYISGTLAMTINGESKLLFDICWRDDSDEDGGIYCGLVTVVDHSTVFPKMFDTFPLGLYEIGDNGEVVRINKKMLQIFGYDNEDEVLKRPAKEFYENEDDFKRFYSEMKENGYARATLKMKKKDGKIMEIDFFTFDIDKSEQARWGMVNDVTEQKYFIRALEDMPTGYYHIEYLEDDNTKGNHKERLIACNDYFAEMLGFKDKNEAIGIDVAKFLWGDKNAGEKYFKALEEADQKGEPLHNYPFKAKRFNSGKIFHIAIDARLLKDITGKVIGRTGTIRDISNEIKLRNRVEETQERLENTTADVNKLIHTFLHPVMKFSGNAELIHQEIDLLKNSFGFRYPSSADANYVAGILSSRLASIKGFIPSDAETFWQDKIKGELTLSPVNDFKYKLADIEDRFEATKKKGVDEITLKKAIRTISSEVLDMLNESVSFETSQDFSSQKDSLLKFLQQILFEHLEQDTNILVSETEEMKFRVEAIRNYIGLKRERLYYAFLPHDVGEILEDNIRRFGPTLEVGGIEIDYRKQGNLNAEISKSDLERVICNLFQNAKKYSYSGKECRYVKVNADGRSNQDSIVFSIQSYGVPIKSNEISSGDIWKFGYRGKLAYSADRDGTGVGLADAKDVIEAHGGKISITSEPATADTKPPKYNVPYLTTVTVEIPKRQKRKKKEKE